MSKFLFVYHGGGMAESEDARAKAMAAWGAWFGQLGDAVVDGGSPTDASVTVKAGGSSQGGAPTRRPAIA